nr:MAG TPA_asm: hypothetical protein [Caudoviricetes sp.]
MKLEKVLKLYCKVAKATALLVSAVAFLILVIR